MCIFSFCEFMNIFFQAVLFSLGAAMLSGVNGFLTKSAVMEVGDPVVFTFLKNAIVAFIFFGVFLWFRKSDEIKLASSRDRWILLLIGIVGGGIPFLLYFIGLSFIPAATAVFIHKTLFLWVAILAIPFLGERVDWLHAFALGLLLFGIVLFQVPAWHSFGVGEILVLLATLLWAVENILAKKVLCHISSLSAMSARMVFGSIVIFLWLIFSGKGSALFLLSGAAWGWVVLTSVLLAGYVSLWYRALSIAPAGFVTSLLVPSAFITGAISSIFVTGIFPASHVAGWIFLVLGVTLLLWKAIIPLFLERRNAKILSVQTR